MAIKILMPALSPTMTEGNLAKWCKKEGDKIKPGEVIAEIETDKATMEVESADKGILGKIIVREKTQGVKVNQLIGIILEEGDDKNAIDKLINEASNLVNETKSTENLKASENKPKEIEKSETKSSGQKITEGQLHSRIFASPLAKRIAENERINLNEIKGTGPQGRIVKDDVLKFQSNSNSGVVRRKAEEFELIELSSIRKVIAKRLLESKQTIPHYYLSADCNVSTLIKAREEINNHLSANKSETKLSVNDFIIKATSYALKMVPAVNAGWSEGGIMLYNNIDISFAVATDDGLITPIIQNADQKTLVSISREVKELAALAKVNKLKPQQFQGGGFTITNLGMYGVKEFQAIINPPQVCILAIGATEKRPIVEAGHIKIADIMTISISCDHRAIDGALAATFLRELKKYIEQPALMLI